MNINLNKYSLFGFFNKKRKLSFSLALRAFLGCFLQAIGMEAPQDNHTSSQEAMVIENSADEYCDWNSAATIDIIIKSKPIRFRKEEDFLKAGSALIGLAHLSNVASRPGSSAPNFLIPAMRVLYESDQGKTSLTRSRLRYLCVNGQEELSLESNKADIYMSGNRAEKENHLGQGGLDTAIKI